MNAALWGGPHDSSPPSLDLPLCGASRLRRTYSARRNRRLSFRLNEHARRAVLGAAVVLRADASLRLDLHDRKVFVVTIDNPDTPARLLNAEASRFVVHPTAN